MYGPGRPLRAVKHRHVSSTNTGPLTYAAARRHFSREICRFWRERGVSPL
jgi:hypothetical protein